MTALDRLSRLLQDSPSTAERLLPATNAIDDVIAALRKQNNTSANTNIPRDLLQLAVHKFWEAQRFETFKDARLVAFGLCVPIRPAGPCIMEDRQRFLALLDVKTGVDQWLEQPRWYRRCYQGLMRGYFMYDAEADRATTVAKQNWNDLRDYLNVRTRNIVDEKINPDWVATAAANSQVFSDNPCAPFAADVLSGDTAKIDYLCDQLGIIKSSWFLRELVFAQVRHATTFSQERFKELIPLLLEILSSNQVLRDRGLILMLDTYASASQPGINEPLRNASVEWWGNPWLPSNEMRWGGVLPATREMVSEWLKREFIEAFFTKLAEDGLGDRRRANFWLRYVKSMNNIQFALGPTALHSKDRDFQALREKMKGLYTELKASGSSNNAFIMTIGNLVAVEFGGMGNALYGYDVRKKLPFDASRPVGTKLGADNSLKHENRMLRLRHQDGIKGSNSWEEMFEETLEEHFDIRPHVALKRSSQKRSISNPFPVPPPSVACTTSNSPVGTESGDAFSQAALRAYAGAHGLKVDDLKTQNGNLWVRTDDSDRSVNKVLLGWGFRFKNGKGWWR